MSSVPTAIETYARAQPEGSVLMAKALIHLGKRASVDQALKRLVTQQRLLRVGRGAYVLPVVSRFGSHSPEPEKVVASLARESGETVVPHGGLSANRLGLTLQVPLRPVFLTSGRSRTLHFGKLEVELRHAGRRTLALGSGRIPETVRALQWLGPEHAQQALEQLARELDAGEIRSLKASRSLMPGWLAAEVSRMLVHG